MSKNGRGKLRKKGISALGILRKLWVLISHIYRKRVSWGIVPYKLTIN
jgi:hypothetical protein